MGEIDSRLTKLTTLETRTIRDDMIEVFKKHVFLAGGIPGVT